MIDIEKTISLRGYDPLMLKPKSARKVWAICTGEGCEVGRWIEYRKYTSLCRSCSLSCRVFSDDHRRKLRENHADVSGENNPMYGKEISEESKIKRLNSLPDMSGENNPMYGKKHSIESKRKMRDNRPDTSNEKAYWYGKDFPKSMCDKISCGLKEKYKDPKERIKLSARCQGISVEEWSGFTHHDYCEKWTEEFKERIRIFYNRLCFLCSMDEEENGRRLDVHHVNYDKDCLCNSQCEFVPLCQKCHGQTNYKRRYWEDLIMCYLYPNRITMIDL